MSGSFSAAVATAGAKEARAVLRKFLSKELKTDEWRLAGRYDAEPKDGGMYRVRIDPDDPLRLEHLPTGQKLVVPYAETLTDFASVPKLLQRLSGKSEVVHLQAESYRDAALFHDMLYEAAWCYAVKANRAVVVAVTKAQADAVLYVALECSGATVADGLLYHGAVSLFGGKAWKQCRALTPEWPPLLKGAKA